MNRTPPGPGAAGVNLGYLLAGAMAGALWIGIGMMLIPLMVVLALVHRLAATGAAPLTGSHHRWLARHHLYSATALVCVLIAPLFALPGLVDTLSTILNTLAYAPHPIATLQRALPQLDLGPPLAFGLIALGGWFVATLWISLRLIRRGMLWAEGRGAWDR